MARPVYQLKAEFFKTLGHPARIRILEVLREGEHTVGDLVPKVGIESSHLSHQLAVLRRNRIVETRKAGATGASPASLSAVPFLISGLLGRRPDCKGGGRGSLRRARPRRRAQQGLGRDRHHRRDHHCRSDEGHQPSEVVRAL